VTPDGSVEEIGEFDTREEATAAYKALELYPPPEPTPVDQDKHQTLDGADLTNSPGEATYH
jgi:hypothetical protein